jgi:exonuclease SbcD
MVSFVYTTDWHLKSLPPQSVEIDNFNNIVIDRISTILSSKTDFILHGGDLFDTYVCDDVSFLNQIIDLFRKFKKRIYIVPGNHDLVGYEPKSVRWASIGTLESAGLVKILNPGLNVIDNVSFYVVYPTKNHTSDLYKGLKNCLVVTHNLISPKPFPYKVTLISDLVDKIDQCIFLCGDLHFSFYEMYENCAFFNPGPLMKIDSSEYNESGFLEIIFDPATFSFKFKKNVFPDVPFSVRTFEQETVNLVSKFDKQKTCSFYKIDDIIEEVSNQLYPNDNKVKEETFTWIRNTEKLLV